jgi:hypothetical protein
VNHARSAPQPLPVSPSLPGLDGNWLGLLGPTRQDSRHEHFLNRLLTRGELARSGPASHFTSSLAILRRADRLVFGSFWGVEPNASPTARLHARSGADMRKNNPPAALRGARGSPKPWLPLLYDSTVSSRRGASASTVLTLSASPHDGQTRVYNSHGRVRISSMNGGKMTLRPRLHSSTHTHAPSGHPALGGAGGRVSD